MTPAQIKQILKDHSVPYYELNGNIYADSGIGGTGIFEEVENVTTWSRKELFDWLGY
jgi:hypothetical protein